MTSEQKTTASSRNFSHVKLFAPWNEMNAPMPSIESNLFYHLLRAINKKKFLAMQFTFGLFDFYNCQEPPKEIYKICRVDKTLVEGHNVFTLSPKETSVIDP